MGNEYRAKVFKSGNSVALRLPAALGLTPGMEFRLIRDESGEVHATPVGIPGASLRDLFGSFSSNFMAEGRLPAEADDRDWGVDPTTRAA